MIPAGFLSQGGTTFDNLLYVLRNILGQGDS